MSKEKVILVDENDTQVGLMPKLEAHQKGLLHRAFSVLFLIVTINYYSKRELSLNIILEVFGRILVAVTPEKVKKQLMQLIED
jgi:hypothetical protein